MLSAVSDVSVVIPVRDRAELIGRCLDSVAAQTVAPRRVIVVDNGSTDDTPARVLEWSRQHPEVPLDLLTEPKPGASAARNRGLKEVTTEYVLFFDSDDEMLPRLIEKASAAIGDSDLVYWQGERIGFDGKRFLTPFYRGELTRRHFYNALLSTQLYMARTSLTRRAGGWEERAMVWNDWELGVRITLQNPSVASVDEVLTRIHLQKKSITGSAFIDKRGAWENTLRLVEVDIERSDLSMDAKRRMLRMAAYRKAILSAQYMREGARAASLELLRKALGGSGLGAISQLWLRILWRYTSAGGRGAYYFWR